MVAIVIGNIIALIASLLMVYSGFIKPKKKILYMQTVQCGLSIISNVVLGGITGAIINAVGCVRNILCYKNKLGRREKIIITIVSIVLCLTFNNIGWIGLLPLLSTVVYIWLMNINDIIKFKMLIIFTMALWFIYDIFIKSYAAAIFDFATIVSNCISIFQLQKINKK